MKRIIITERQYRRLVGRKLNEEITDTGELVNDFQIDIEGKLLMKWNKNNRNHVKRIQKMLSVVGYEDELGPYGVDGKYGNYTENAVREFQKEVFPEEEIEWDGIVGPKTYEKLIEMVRDIADEEDLTVDELLDYSEDEEEEISYVDDEDYTDDIDFAPSTVDDYLSQKDPMVKGENGNLSIKELTYIGKDISGNKEYLSKEAGIMFNKMKEDAEMDGVIIELSDAYRPCGRPGDYKRYKAGEIRFTQWAAWEENNFNAALAAKPNPSKASKWMKEGGGFCTSNHGWGKAIDVHNWDARSWVKNNGKKYGFYPYYKENWHFDYKGIEDVPLA